MKNTIFEFLGFPSNDDYVVSKGKDGFKLDFSKANAADSCCSKTQGNTKSKGVISILMLLMLFLFSNISTAQITVDGNPIDWNSANFNTFPVKSYVLDPYGTGQVDNQFTGSKDFFLADGTGSGYLGWVIGQTKAKNDIANAAAVLHNGILYFAGDRTSNNGDAQIGFWFFLNGTSPRTLFTSPHAGGDFAPAHAQGDILVLADFTGGGGTATVNVYRWKGSGPLTPGSSIVPNTNGNLETTNIVGIVAENNASTYPIPTGWSFLNPIYDTNEFYEGRVDLSGLNLNNTCFSSFLLEARASQSVTASLDDFAGGNFNVRPTVSINNVTVCAGQPATFTATPNGGVAPLTYSFNGGPFGASNTFTINPATTNGSVTVVVKGAGPNFCESDVATGTLTVNPVPTVTVNSPSKCSNDPAVTVTATPSPAGTYTYVWNVPVGAVNPGNVASFSASVAGVYSVTITTTGGVTCSGSGSGTLTVNPSPTLVTHNPAPVCAPLTVDLTAPAVTAGSNLQGGTLSYWTNAGATIPLNNPNAVSASGIYYIKVTTSANCTDIEPVTVTVIPVIPIVINCPQNSTTSACAYADQAALVTAFNNWVAGFTASGGNGTLTTSGLQNLSAPNLCAGGSVTVNFSASDECGKQASCSATFTITAAPIVNVSQPTNSSTSACAYVSQAAVDAAFATWLGGFSVSGGCAPQGSYGQVSAPNACGGTTTVTYTVTDRCYETSTVSRSFTITAAPIVNVSQPTNSSTSACAYVSQAAVDAAFATWLGGFSVSGGCAPQGSYGQVSAPNACGGTTTVTYTVTDRCYETSTVSRSFTITAAPIVNVSQPTNSSTSACAYVSQAAVDAAFATWLGGFSVSGGCAPQGSYGQVSAPNACGGTTTVTYTVTDRCYETSTVTRSFTITAAPIVNVSQPTNSSTSACAYVSQAAVDAAFATWLGGFSVSGGCAPQGSYGQVSAPNACGGTTTVTYTVTDRCYETSTVTRSFTITAAPIVNVSQPTNSSTSACAYVSQAAVDAAFATWLGGFSVSGGCAPQGSYGQVSAPNACGGTTTVTYTVTDRCYETSTVSRSFTITAAPQVNVSQPTNSSTSACAYVSQAAVDAAFATWLGGFSVSGGCAPQGSYGQVSAPNACGGTTTVTYTVTDRCYETSTVSRSFTITAAPIVNVSQPTNSSTSACAYVSQAAVDAAFATWLGGFSVSGGCAPQGSYGQVSAPNACGGTTTVTYTVTDRCYETSTVTRSFTITAAPIVNVSQPTNSSTSACAYVSQAAVDAAFATWLGGFSVSGGCAPQGSYGQVSAPNACGGTTTVTYTVTDRCYETSTVSRSFTITAAPQVNVSQPTNSSTSACAYVSQAAVDAAFATWLGGFSVSGGCAPQGSYGQVSAPNACGGTTTVTYTVTDRCYETSTVTRSFTITAAPIVNVSQPTNSSTSACAYVSQAAVDAAFATWLGGFSVSGGCAPQGSYGQVSAPNACGGTTTVTYTVTDRCYETSTVTRSFTITAAPIVNVSQPTNSSTSACAYVSQAAVDAAFATWLGGFSVSGGCAPQGSYGQVSAPNACGGTTTVTYTVTDRCYETSTVTRSFTITAAPIVNVSQPTNSSTSACAYVSQAAVDAAFATWLGGFSVSGGCAPQGSYGQVSAPNACGGTTTVTYTVTDRCYETSTVSRSFTITAAPQVNVSQPTNSSTSACAYVSQAAVDAAFATWLGGFSVSGGCAPQGSYGQVSAPNACGGTTTVTYTVTDRCYETSTVTRSFTITAAPIVNVSQPTNSSTSACAYVSQAAVDAAFATWLGGFSVSGGCAPQGSYGQVSAPNACGGTTTVTYTVTDRCYETSTVSRSFTITAAPIVNVSQPTNSSTSACAYVSQAAVDAAFATWLGGFSVSGGCAPQGSYGQVSAPNACGGTTTVTYTVTDRCYETSTVSRSFTITAAPIVNVSQPTNSSTSACAYVSQAAVDAAFATWLGGFSVSGGCAPQGSYGQVSAPNACGGTTTVTYTVTDRCYETSTVTRSFTITAAPIVNVSQPTNSSTSACAYVSQAAVDAAFATWLGGFSVSGGCAPQGSYGQVSAPNACGGTTTVTYTVTDRCYETSTVSRSFTITAAPQVNVSQPTNSSTSACAYVSQAAVDAAFATWLGGFSVSGGCAPQGSYGQVSAPNACGGTTTVTYTVTDRCYETSTVSRSFTITAAPQVNVSQPTNSSTSACAYVSQAAVDAAFATWLGGFSVSGGCAPQGSYGQVSAPNACGGTTTVTYTVTDRCYETSTVSRSFTITAAPQVNVSQPTNSSTSACAYVSQAAVDAAFATWLGGFSVSGGCAPQGSYGQVSAPNACGGTTTVTYTVTDRCYETSTVSRSFTITAAPQVNVSQPTNSSTSACAYVSQAAVDAAFATWLGGFSVSGGCAPQGSYGQVSAPNACGGTTTVTYTVTDRCYETSTVSRSFTITAAPQVNVSQPTNSSTSACAYVSQAAVDAAFATWLGGFSVSGGCAPQGSYGQVSAPNACGGTTTVTYTVTDRCYETSTVSRSFTITAAPIVNVSQPTNSSTSACAYVSQAAVDAAFATWLGGFSVSGGCAPQGSYGQVSAPNACGGTTTVTYTVTDRCYETSTVTRSFTITAAPIVNVSQPTNSSTSACAYVSQAAVDAAFATWLGGFSVSGGCAPQGSYGQVSAPNACGGTTTVTYTVTDRCYETSTVSRSFTITAAPIVNVSQPTNSSTSACAYVSQAAVDAAFATWLGGFSVSGGCAPQGSYGQVSAPNACGGTTTVTYTVTDRCYETSTVSRSFTIIAPPALVLGSPDSTIVNSCDYADQAALDVAFATWLSQFTVTGGCAPVGDYGAPIVAPLCTGGTTTVTYTVTDKCASPSVTETFTVVPATKLEIICPADKTVECGEDAAALFAIWRDTFGHTGGCANAVSTDLSQIQMPEPGEELVVTFTVTDNCQTVSCTARFFINECAYCTYTQGYYGNIKGSACTPEGATTNAKTIMINAVTLAGGEYNFGSTITGNYFKLTLADITSNNIFKMMPGGGTPRALIGYATYSVPSTYSDNDPLKGSGTQKGRINNVLLSQTMALFFNTQLNSELGDFELEPSFVTADTGVCGSDTPVPGTEQLFTIPQQVINYLSANGGATVSNLFVMANRALGGQSIGSATPSQVNQAVDAINRGFDECRVYVGSSMPDILNENLVVIGKTEVSDAQGMDVKIYPNPYTDNFNLSLSTSNEGKVAIAIYDMIGRLIETRELNPRESSEVRIGDKYPSGVYNVVVTQGEEVKTLKVIKR